MSDQKVMATDKMATLLDSCVQARMHIDSALVQQLAENAAHALKQITAKPSPTVDILLQASPDGSKTIKPTLTFDESAKGAVAVRRDVVERLQKQGRIVAMVAPTGIVRSPASRRRMVFRRLFDSGIRIPNWCSASI